MNISSKKYFLSVKDYSVSQEVFELYHDEVLDMLITHPQPSLDNLGKYYESLDYISHTDSKRSLFEKAYHFVKGISFVKDTTELASQSFDCITMWHVLEHVPDLDFQIKELKRLLKPSGSLLVAVPNFKSYDAKHYQNFWAAYDVPIHFWHFSKQSIQMLFQKENMSLINILPMKFDSFYVSLLSEKYKTGKMNFIKAFFIGLRSNWKGSQNKEYSSHIYVLKNKQN